MQELTAIVNAFAADTLGKKIHTCEQLPASGGDRIYFRLKTGEGNCVAAYSDNRRETDAFLYLSEIFERAGVSIPKIISANADRTVYLQEDLGNEALLDVLLREGETARVKLLYQKSLSALLNLQLEADKLVDYHQSFVTAEFGKQSILNDLNYFKYYFADTLGIKYNKDLLTKEFDSISTALGSTGFRAFMYRDFQARNIMIKNDGPVFIDYQGGMKGPIVYDVASLLWQAKANLTDSFKNDLLQHYMNEAELKTASDQNTLQKDYESFVILRLLQVLGAYGFRGLFEKKAHFVASIAQGLKNLIEAAKTYRFPMPTPALDQLIEKLADEKIAQLFTNVRATKDSPLRVLVQSFSFIKTGYPKEASAHGGGFVFDCRGILNPGRVEEHKLQTGRDKPVQEYLVTHTRMAEFLTGVYSVVDIAVEDYIKRGFDHLSINFGCTGGQHRSVYAADAMAAHLLEKYNVHATVKHLEQNFADQ